MASTFPSSHILALSRLSLAFPDVSFHCSSSVKLFFFLFHLKFFFLCPFPPAFPTSHFLQPLGAPSGHMPKPLAVKTMLFFFPTVFIIPSPGFLLSPHKTPLPRCRSCFRLFFSPAHLPCFLLPLITENSHQLPLHVIILFLSMA